VAINWQNNALNISGTSGNVFHEWLNAIGQVDTTCPQFHWKIQGLCVGEICGQNIRWINLVGE
jgi:hypothetical protein